MSTICQFYFEIQGITSTYSTELFTVWLHLSIETICILVLKALLYKHLLIKVYLVLLGPFGEFQSTLTIWGWGQTWYHENHTFLLSDTIKNLMTSESYSLGRNSDNFQLSHSFIHSFRHIHYSPTRIQARSLILHSGQYKIFNLITCNF